MRTQTYFYLASAILMILFFVFAGTNFGTNCLFLSTLIFLLGWVVNVVKRNRW